MTHAIVSTADNFNRAVSLWFELTGLDPDAKRWSMGEYTIKRLNDEIEQSMEYDPSLVTAYLLLAAYSKNYFSQRTVSIADLDSDEDTVFEYMAKVREFKKLIRTPEVAQVADAFLEQMRKALLSYGVESDRINAFLDNRSNLAFIRRDALKSANRLRVNQFLAGETDPDEVKPVYNRDVFGYWNINSMIEHVCSMPSGISLNLIRDRDELHSYFAFAVRNGGNLLFLTDIMEYAHPLGRSMRRRPDRDYDERVGKNWFPYQLLQIAYDDDGNAYHDVYSEAKEKGVVPHQPTFFKVSKLVDLDVAQIAWTALMFEAIHDRYWKQPMPVLELSYTNEMIRLEDQHVLLSAAAKSNLPVAGYQPLNLARLTTQDVMSDALDEAAIGKKYEGWEHRYGRNRWMEERYGHLVPEEALNLIGQSPDTQLFLSFHSDKEHKSRWSSDTNTIAPVADSDVRRLDLPENASSFDRRDPLGRLDTQNNPVYGLEKVDGTLFGTRSEIDADRKFIARYNFALGLQREADREFERERGDILRWFKNRVTANEDRLIAFAHFDEGVMMRRPAHIGFTQADVAEEKYHFATLNDLTRKLERYEYSAYTTDWSVNFTGGVHYKPYYQECYLTGARSSWQLFLQPGGAKELAFVTDTKVEDLPPYLQNWNPGNDDYVGNAILNRIDPLEWKLDNPWNQISFAISFYLSKRGLAQVRKNYPKPEVEDVSDLKTVGLARQRGHNRSRIHHSNWDPDKYIKATK